MIQHIFPHETNITPKYGFLLTIGFWENMVSFWQLCDVAQVVIICKHIFLAKFGDIQNMKIENI
jgi:hypothetical protein